MNIVITGGSRGFGLAMAEKLHKQHTCILLARASEALTEAGQKLDCPIYVCNVAEANEVDRTIKTIEASHGPIDILINNAGIWIEGALETNSYEMIEQVIKTNILGVMYPAKAVIGAMKARKQGLIINISSQSGFKTKANRSIYQATKWAVRGFSHSLLEEARPFGVRVTTVYPGTADTGFFEHSEKQIDPEKALRAEDVAETVAWIIAQPPSLVFPEVGLKNVWQ
jgi:NADP-dependent 3-hydroxy acid dehydrogenase YdfG